MEVCVQWGCGGGDGNKQILKKTLKENVKKSRGEKLRTISCLENVTCGERLKELALLSSKKVKMIGEYVSVFKHIKKEVEKGRGEYFVLHINGS